MHRLRSIGGRNRIRLHEDFDDDGGCADFVWGFILGFLFSFIFVVIILLCRMKKMAKLGVLCGFAFHMFISFNS